jgi:hypothetical protein
MKREPTRSTMFRRVSIAFFLISMPLTLIDSHDTGIFVDADGWQGYDIVFTWPVFIPMMGGWILIPSMISNAYVVVGMWIKNLPIYVHLFAWFMCVPTILTVLWGLPKDVHASFLFLALAWILSGIGPFKDWLRSKDRQSVNTRAPTPDATASSN